VSRCILLVDGTALFVRSSRAGRGTGMNAAGVPTATLTLFTHSLARLLREHRPGHVLVAFDGPGARKWRRDLFPGYKAARPDPPEYHGTEHKLVCGMLAATGIATVAYDGFEADDVIAWAWRQVWAGDQPSDARVIIAADDADMHQLLWGRTVQVPLGAGGQKMDRDGVVSKYGCEPDQLPFLRALAGDPSDGIPGVPGVGPFRALILLREHGWSLSEVTSTMEPQQARLVLMYEDILDLLRPIRAIDYKQGIDRYPFMEITEWSSGKSAGAAEFFAGLGMIRTLGKLEAGSLW
jgi:DNA polymerase-1